MPKLRNPVLFETTFGSYEVDELLGEGGAGRVFGGVDSDRRPIAIKVLAEERASSDKRKRFKNEISFLARNKHPNIVTVIDHGVSRGGEMSGPFYVMRRYHSNLRELMGKGIAPNDVLPLFSQILDGVEAAHLQNVVHRDLKPENILHESDSNNLAIADFGTARFTEDLVAAVATVPGQRLANFQYAAPEQRATGSQVGAPADIYALGLMLNEMYTRTVPHGTDYRLISQIVTEYAFLDAIVANMLRQNPEERPQSVANVKALVERHRSEAVSRQRLSKIQETVVRVDEIDDPLALTPPKLVGADWNNGELTLILDRPVTHEWVQALQSMGSYSSVLGKPPGVFSFHGNQATVGAGEHQVQALIDNFKGWLPTASQTLKRILEQAAQRAEAERKARLHREQEAEERRLRVLSRIRI